MNPEHFQSLSMPLLEFNHWRMDFPTELDLSGAILQGLDLSDRRMAKSNLTDADCSDVNFSRAFFHQTLFADTKLMRANFSSARLSDCTIMECDATEVQAADMDFGCSFVRGSRFDRADLSRCNFGRCTLISLSLRDADLSEAVFGHTIIADTDMSEAKSLNGTRHWDRSHIAVDCLTKLSPQSATPVVLEFFTSCGILANDVLQFISRSRRGCDDAR